MKKQTLAALAVPTLALALGLSACGGGSAPGLSGGSSAAPASSSAAAPGGSPAASSSAAPGQAPGGGVAVGDPSGC